MKKLLSLFLALLMCFALLPVAVAEQNDDNQTSLDLEEVSELQSESDEYVDSNSPDDDFLDSAIYINDIIFQNKDSNSIGVLNKMELVNADIDKDFPTKLFTVDGKVCSDHTGFGGYCDNCKLSYIYKAKKGEDYPGNGDWWTCAAFAQYYYYLTFGVVRKNWTKTGLDANDPSSWESLMPGDYVLLTYTSPKDNKTHTHYVIFVSADGEGITVNNANRSAPRKIDFNEKLKFTDYYFNGTMDYKHSDNYNDINTQYGGPVAQYIAQCDPYPTYGIVNTTQSAKLWNMPCSDKTNSAATSNETLESGKTVTVIGLYKNTAGKYWYKTVYNGNVRYFYAAYATWSGWKGTDITLSGATNPSQIVQGNSFSIGGTVLSTYNQISALYAYCYPGSATSGTPTISSSDTGLSTQSYPLSGSTLDKNLKFGTLSVGTYKYALKAKCKYYYATSGTSITSSTSSEYLFHANGFTVVPKTTTVTVTFNANGGSASYTSKTVTVGSTYGDLPTATRTGYYFVGWFTASSGGSQVTPSTTVTSTSSHTLYAQWTPYTYTVTLNANGGSVSPSSITVTYDGTYSGLPTPTRTGYNFNGWYTAASGGSKVTESTTVTTASDHTLYAQWTARQYTVWFVDSDYYGTVDAKTVTYGSTYGTLPSLSRTGYNFNGWYTAANGGSRVTESTTVTTASDHMLYAQWTAKALIVTFDANGGTVSPETKVVTYGSAYGELPTPTCEDRQFNGWYKSDGTEVTETTIVTDLSDHTLTAKYSLLGRMRIRVYCELDGEFSLETTGFGTYDFYLNGERVLDNGTCFNEIRYRDKEGTYELSDIRVEDGKSFNGIFKEYPDNFLSSGTPAERTGTLADNRTIILDFTTVQPKEWLNGRDFTVRYYNDHTYWFFDENVTWYEAKTICEYLGGHLVTIADGVENTAVYELSNGQNTWLGGRDSENEGIWKWITDETFAWNAWNSGEPNNNVYNDEGCENYLIQLADGSWNDEPGYYKFPFVCEFDSASSSSIKVTITYDPNGGVLTGKKYFVKSYGSYYAKQSTAEREGYAFMGWFTEPEGGTTITSSTKITKTEDHTLYAHWTREQLPEFDGTVEWNSADVEYKGTTPYVIANGSAQTPRFTVKDKNGNVVSANSYTYEYRENTNAGTGYVIVTFKGAYTGTAQAWFKIYLPATEWTNVENVQDGILIQWTPVEGAAGYVIYRRAWSTTTNGWTSFERWWNVTGTEWIDGSDQNHKVYAGTRYQYGVKAYFERRYDPVADAEIGGNVNDPSGNYNLGIVGPLKTTVRITTRELKSVEAGSKKLTAKWGPSRNFTGYELQYATDANFTQNVRTVVIEQKDNIVSSYTVTGLTSGKTYYVRVRSYHEFEGFTYYGEWSNVLNCKVK